MKMVLNTGYGCFELSDKAEDRLKELKGLGEYDSVRVDRQDPDFIKVVEELGRDASGEYSHLEVVYVPDDATDWMLKEYDGVETVYYVLDGKIYTA